MSIPKDPFRNLEWWVFRITTLILFLVLVFKLLRLELSGLFY